MDLARAGYRWFPGTPEMLGRLKSQVNVTRIRSFRNGTCAHFLQKLSLGLHASQGSFTDSWTDFVIFQSRNHEHSLGTACTH